MQRRVEAAVELAAAEVAVEALAAVDLVCCLAELRVQSAISPGRATTTHQQALGRNCRSVFKLQFKASDLQIRGFFDGRVADVLKGTLRAFAVLTDSEFP